jgi:hypothetical protein
VNRISRIVLLAAIFSTGSLFAEEEQTQTLVQGQHDNSIFIAPDFKFTEVDGRFANLAGIYGGWLIDHKLLLGGGGYFLTNRSDDFKMTYGGFVVEYFVRSDQLVNFSIKGLLGAGNATIPSGFGRFREILPFDIPQIGIPFGNRSEARGPRFPINFPIFPGLPAFDPIDEGFFVAEPEASIMLNITDTFRIGFGGGYRFIGGAGRTRDRLDGFTASVTLKLAF